MSGRNVPEEVKADLTKFAEEYHIELEEVQKMFKMEYEKDYLSSYEEASGERARQAALIVKAELSAGGRGDSGILEGVVFSVSGIVNAISKNDKEYKYCDVHGLFSENPGKDPFKMARIRCFGDTALSAKNIPRNVPIKVNVSADEYNGKITYSISNTLHYQVVEATKAGFNLRDFIKKIFKPRKDGEEAIMKIEEMPYRISEDDTDYKVVEGRVKRSGIKTSSKGFTYVYYTMYDDFRGTDEVMYVKVGLTDQVFDTGALVWAIGINKEAEEGRENDKPSMFAEAVVGIIPKTVDQEKYDAMLANAKAESTAKAEGEKMAQKAAEDTDFSGLKEQVAKSPINMTDLGW